MFLARNLHSYISLSPYFIFRKISKFSQLIHINILYILVLPIFIIEVLINIFLKSQLDVKEAKEIDITKVQWDVSEEEEEKDEEESAVEDSDLASDELDDD